MRETGDIIIDIKKNGKDCYNELWEKMKKLVFSIAFDYSRKYDFEFDDVKQNAYIAWKSLTEGFSLDKMRGENIEGNYVNYLNKYLPKRLHNYVDSYSMFSDFKVMSYDQFSGNGEFLTDELVAEGVGNQTESIIMTIENNLDKLSNREEQVYFMLKKGYRQVDIANKLDLARPTVHNYKENLYDKLKDILDCSANN